MERVVRAVQVQQLALAAATVLAVALIALAMLRTERPGMVLVGIVLASATLVLVTVAMRRWSRRTPPVREPQVVTAAELPPVEPLATTVAKVVALHLVAGVFFVGLLLVPYLQPAGGITVAAACSMVWAYAVAWHRIARQEHERGGTLWASSGYAWTANQARSASSYLVVSGDAVTAPTEAAGRP